MTLLAIINFLLVQWFCIRLCRIVEKDGGEQIRWGFIAPIAPLTGWWSDYWPKKYTTFVIEMED